MKKIYYILVAILVLMVVGVFVHKQFHKVDTYKFTFQDGRVQYTCVISNLVSNYVRITGAKKIRLTASDSASIKNLVIPSEVSFNGIDFKITVFDPERILFIVDTVTIPENITYFNPEVFYGMPNFKHVKVEEGSRCFKSVDGVLYDSAMTELMLLPRFKACDSFPIPEGVRMVHKSNIFRNHYIRCVNIPQSLVSVTDEKVNYPTVDDSPLQRITVDTANTSFCSVDGVLLTADTSRIVYYPSGRTEDVYNIPQGVRTITSQNFYFHKLHRLYFPETVDTVDAKILCNRDLESVDTAYIPRKVKLNDFAFELNRKIIIIRK